MPGPGGGRLPVGAEDDAEEEPEDGGNGGQTPTGDHDRVHEVAAPDRLPAAGWINIAQVHVGLLRQRVSETQPPGAAMDSHSSMRDLALAVKTSGSTGGSGIMDVGRSWRVVMPAVLCEMHGEESFHV